MITQASVPRLDSLPAVDDCERGLLAAIMLDPRTADEASRLVLAEDFATDRNGRLFAALVELREAGKPIGDLLVLVPELNKLGLDWRGKDLVELTEQGFPHHARHYAIEIRRASLLRKQIIVANEIIQRCHDRGADPREIGSWVDAQFSSLADHRHGTVSHVGEVAADVLNQIQEDRPRSGAWWGIRSIDDHFGQMADGRLCILAAETGGGKTAFAGQVAIHNAQQGRNVLFVSLEMTREELVERWMCSECGIDSRHLQAGELTAGDKAVLAQAKREFEAMPIHIFDTHGASIKDIRAVARLQQRGSGLEFLVVDYLSKITPSKDDVKRERRERIGNSCWGLKSLAKELRIPVLCLHQLNRESAGSRPTLHHLADSADVERDSDLVAFIHHQGQRCNFIVDKHRFGAKGTVPMSWDAPLVRFGEYEEFPV